MISRQEISAHTGLDRSSAMYPGGACGNGWRNYTLRRAREITYPIFTLARAGDIDAIAAELRLAGETAPRTVARSMIRAARRSGDLPAVKWIRNDRDIRLGATTLHWDLINKEWRHWFMFGA